MTPDELTSLINRRLMEEATGPGTRPAVFHVKDEKLHGIGVAHLPRGEAHDTSKASLGGGICIVDDREPDRLGPISFDPMRMANLLKGASFIAIDSAALSEKVYNELMDIVAMGNTVLAVQTTAERHSIWRMYVGMHWRGTEILEVVPVKGDPLRTFETVVTAMDRGA